MDNKLIYKKAELQLIFMDNKDVIQTSTPFEEDGGVVDDSWTT